VPLFVTKYFFFAIQSKSFSNIFSFENIGSLLPDKQFIMGNGAYGANSFTGHAGNIAWGVDSNCIEGGDKTRLLRTNRNTSPAMDAGIPSNLKNNWFFFRHVHSNFFVFRIGAEIG
jgi:hypothetical protein